MNKKLLCTAVGASLAATAGLAQARVYDYGANFDAGFIPYVVKDTNRTTVVTVMRAADSGTSGETLHLQYWTKSTTAANTAACEPSSVYIPYTPNDVLTFDTAGILGYPLFGDTTNPAPLGTAISLPGPRHGYLYLDTQEHRDEGSDYLNHLYWLEIDLANGGAIGDHGIGIRDEYDLNNRINFAQIMGASSGGGDIQRGTAVNFWPSSVASTAFTVTPVGTDMLTRENNQVVVQVFNNLGVQGAYDRNENGVDGTVPITVRCVGRVTPAQLMPGVVTNAAWAAQGGWGNLVNIGDGNAGNGSDSPQGGTNAGDMDAFIYQVDSSSAGGKFSVPTNTGIYNN